MNTVFKVLEKKFGGRVESRRYDLPTIISESYKSLYECSEGSNLKRLVESHLNDVRENPTDLDRLSRQLCTLKHAVKMVESKRIKDSDLRVKESSYDPYASILRPKPAEGSSMGYNGKFTKNPKYSWYEGDYDPDTNREQSCYSNDSWDDGMFGCVLHPNDEIKTYDAEIWTDGGNAPIEKKDGFKSKRAAQKWVKDWFANRTNESKRFRKPMKRVKESNSGYRWSGMQPANYEYDGPHNEYASDDESIYAIVGGPDGVEYDYYTIEIHDDSNGKVLVWPGQAPEYDTEEEAKRWVENWISSYLEDKTRGKSSLSEGRVVQYGVDIIDPPNGNVESMITEALEGAGLKVAGCMCSDISWSKKDYGIGESKKSRRPMKRVKEAESIKLAKGNTFRNAGHDWEILDHEGSYTLIYAKSRKFNPYAVVRDIDPSDGVWAQGHYFNTEKDAINDFKKMVNEGTSWDSVKEGLQNFGKSSSSKAFFKTLKKMHKDLKEGKTLTRQESINLYKAANSAMTHLSVELEHNPKFLPVFKECTSILSKDVASLLESLKRGKSPSKRTMESLAKFYEASTMSGLKKRRPLKEDEHLEDEEYVPEEEFVVDEEGLDLSEQELEFEEEYAQARKELYDELAEKYAETEDPGVQDRLAQEAEQVAILTGEDPEDEEGESSEGEEDVEDEESEDEVVEESNCDVDEEEVIEESSDEDPDLTEDEIAELKKHLEEIRKNKKITTSESVLKDRKLRKSSK